MEQAKRELIALYEKASRVDALQEVAAAVKTTPTTCRILSNIQLCSCSCLMDSWQTVGSISGAALRTALPAPAVRRTRNLP